MSMDRGRVPALYQNLKTLSSCPGFGGLMRNSTFGVLGTIQIMVGLFNIGLGPGRTSTRPGDLTSLGAPYWLGAVCIAAGILSVIIGQCPCVCFTWYAVFMNIAGCIFAIIGIVLYAIDVAEASVVWMCDSNWSTAQYDDNCRYVAFFAQSLLTAMDVTLIVLTVLQLCVCISAAVLGIRALSNRMKGEFAVAHAVKIVESDSSTKSSSTVTETSPEAGSGNSTAFSCSRVVAAPQVVQKEEAETELEEFTAC